MDWNPLIQECAPQVALSTMQAVIRTESGFNPNALNINGGARLARQPSSRREAAAWAQWLISRGYSVDLGLMQINSANLPRLGLTASTVFDPCRNLQAGASILVDNYNRALRESKNSRTALLKAISAYNTGNFHGGFRNGYVARVVRAPAVSPQIVEQDVPPLLLPGAARHKSSGKKKHKSGGVSEVNNEYRRTEMQAQSNTESPELADTGVTEFRLAAK